MKTHIQVALAFIICCAVFCATTVPGIFVQSAYKQPFIDRTKFMHQLQHNLSEVM